MLHRGGYYTLSLMSATPFDPSIDSNDPLWRARVVDVVNCTLPNLTSDGTPAGYLVADLGLWL